MRVRNNINSPSPHSNQDEANLLEQISQARSAETLARTALRAANDNLRRARDELESLESQMSDLRISEGKKVVCVTRFLVLTLIHVRKT